MEAMDGIMKSILMKRVCFQMLKQHRSLTLLVMMFIYTPMGYALEMFSNPVVSMTVVPSSFSSVSCSAGAGPFSVNSGQSLSLSISCTGTLSSGYADIRFTPNGYSSSNEFVLDYISCDNGWMGAASPGSYVDATAVSSLSCTAQYTDSSVQLSPGSQAETIGVSFDAY